MANYTNTFEENQTTQYTLPPRTGSDSSIDITPPESKWKILRQSCSRTVAIGTFFGFFIGLIFGGLYLHKNDCPDTMTTTTVAPPNHRGNSSLLIESGPPCNAHGQLYNNTCYCDSGYIGEECDYNQKSQTVAFCLEFFLGIFGSGYFYMGLNSLGIAQLLVLLSPVILVAMIGACCNKSFDCDTSGYRCMDILWRLAFFVFWLVSVILIGMNKLNDGNDKPLEAW